MAIRGGGSFKIEVPKMGFVGGADERSIKLSIFNVSYSFLYISTIP